MPVDVQIDPPKIITIAGPKGGVGKTVFALNLAFLRASQTGRGVVLVDTDPFCRGELLAWTGMTRSPSIKELLEFYAKAGGGPKAVDLVRGKIPFGPTGVACVPFGFSSKDVVGNFEPAPTLQFLRGLASHYDVFLDVECAYAMLGFALEVADWSYWVIIPQRQLLAATLVLFEDLKLEHFPLDRVEIVVNQFNIPGAMRVPEMEQALYAYNKKIQFILPWEDGIPQAANAGLGYMVRSNPNSAWVKAVRFVANHLRSVKPKGSSASIGDLMHYLEASNSLWKLNGGAASADTANDAADKKRLEGANKADPNWDRLKEDVHSQVVAAMETQRIRVGADEQGSQDLKNKVGGIITSILDKRSGLEFTREDRERFLQELMDEILGLGPLEVLLRDPSITELMINSHDKIYVERKGKLTLTALRFRNDEQLIEAIKRIVAPLGRRIDESVPLVDARLKDGSRVNAVIPPLAVSGPTLTIRRFSAKPLDAEKMIAMGCVTAEMLEFIEACILIAKNVIISGGTGTGKTTFLNLLSSYIPSDQRILTIEDVAELRLQQEHWVRLEARPPNIEGKGEVSIRELVKNALRMRPDRIVVGECRGGEAVDMLQAMNTGHDGSMTTIHSNTARDALNRIETMCLMSGMDLPVWVLREMISSAVHVIAQLTRLEDGSRKVTSIVAVTGRDENQVMIQEVFKFIQTGVSAEGKVLGYHTATGIVPKIHYAFAPKGIVMSTDIFKAKPEYAEHLKKEEANKQAAKKEAG